MRFPSLRSVAAAFVLALLLLPATDAAPAEAQGAIREMWAITWGGRTQEVEIDFEPYGVAFNYPVSAHCAWVGAPHCREGTNDVMFANPMEDGVTFRSFSGTLVVNGAPTSITGVLIRRVSP